MDERVPREGERNSYVINANGLEKGASCIQTTSVCVMRFIGMQQGYNFGHPFRQTHKQPIIHFKQLSYENPNKH